MRRRSPPSGPIRRAGPGTVLVLSLVTQGGAAFAGDAQSAVDLAWTAPDDCPSRDEVLASLRPRTGDPGARAPLAATVVIRREGARFSARLTLRSAEGAEERAFDAPSCVELAHGIAVILAVAADASVPVAREKPGVQASAAPPVQPAPPARAPFAFGAAAAAGVTIDDGLLPILAPGGQIAAGALLVDPRWTFRADAFAEYAPAQRATPASRPSQGGELSLFGVGGRACAARRIGPFELGPCAGGEVDVVHANAFGGTSNPGGDGRWGALEAGGAVSWSVARSFALRAGADALFVLAHPTFVVDVGDAAGESLVVHRPAAIGFRAAVTGEVRFF